jgi:hypothetical protein
VPCACVLYAYIGLFVRDGQARTIRFETDSWENNSWGLHNVDRRKRSGTVSIFSDGSRTNTGTWEYRKYYFVRGGNGQWHTIYLPSHRSTYVIEEDKRVVSRIPCTCTWEPSRIEPDDAECSRSADRLGLKQRAGYGVVAGIPVVQYRAKDRSASHAAAFAPAFGCELMEEEETTYNDYGLPTSHRHTRVTSYIPGEPEPALLTLPTGYPITERRY